MFSQSEKLYLLNTGGDDGPKKPCDNNRDQYRIGTLILDI